MGFYPNTVIQTSCHTSAKAANSSQLVVLIMENTGFILHLDLDVHRNVQISSHRTHVLNYFPVRLVVSEEMILRCSMNSFVIVGPHQK